MIDSKTTTAMLGESSYLPPDSQPLRILTILDSKHSRSVVGGSTPYVRVILDFLIEIIIIHSLSHWISTQGISIRMSYTWLVDYLEVEVLQHVDPPSLSSMRVKYCRQPFKWLVVRSQSEMCAVQILPEVQDSPYQCITLPFHGVEFPLSHTQSFAGVSYYLLTSALPL
jgi:hypothetical protein